MTAEEILAALQAILDTASADGDRDLTEEESERAEQLRADYTAAVARAERSNVNRTAIAELGRVRFSRGARVAGSDESGPNEEELAFRDAFRAGHLASPMDIWGDAEQRAQSSTTTAGGYTVPAGFRQKLVDRQVMFGGIAREADQFPTDDWVDYPFPTIDDTGNSAEIVAENGAPAGAGADLVFGTKTLKAYRIVSSGASNTWLKVPVQLMDNSYLNFENLVAQKLGERLGRKEAAYAAVGTGSGEPEGLLTGATAFTTAVTSNTVGMTWANILDAVFAIDPAYRTDSCIWVMNDAILKLVAGQVDGDDRPILMQNAMSSLAGKVEYTIAGYRVVIDNAMPATWGDDAKTVVFGNVKEAFVVRRVKNPIIVSDPLQFFLNGQIGFLGASGFGSLVQNPNAVVALKGANV